MSHIKVNKLSGLHGSISVPGDKSISHRAIMISSLAKGKSSVSNFLNGLDCRATADAFVKMGIPISFQSDGTMIIEGNGLHGLNKPESDLYLGNSGTTMRLLMGILAGQNFSTILSGDESLSVRPMKRVAKPLRSMGALIEGADDANLAPLTINGSKLNAITYNSPVASAQVKSAIMFAGLFADGVTRVTEPHKSRDHTERMLKLYGADLDVDGLSISVKGMVDSKLHPQPIIIPGDISSAAFLIALGVLTENSELIIRSCGINPTRIGILNVLGRMGADVELLNQKEDFEPQADILVKSSSLRSTKITRNEIPLLIDEIPIISLCATQAKGTTTIEGVGELRVKETDRINSIMTNLKAFGADLRCEGDDLFINGPSKLEGAPCDSFGDHRTAMMSVVAGAIASGETIVNDTDCISISFPGFIELLYKIKN
ncbi:3-phosphoshikimate 1-carboxyvinyltransferase [Candidatus Omnitrophota bacterium]